MSDTYWQDVALGHAREIERLRAEVERLRALGQPARPAVAVIVADGKAHLYEDADEAKDKLASRRWVCAGWINGVEWHPASPGAAGGGEHA